MAEKEFGNVEIKCLNCGERSIEKFEPTKVYNGTQCAICGQNTLRAKRIKGGDD